MNRFFTLLFAASCLTAVGQVPDYVPTNGLVGWWPLDGNAIDNGASSIDGIIYGATSGLDRWGDPTGAMRFQNVGDRIELGEISSNIGSPNSALTISCWFKGEAFPSSGASSGQLVSAYYGLGQRQIRLEVVHAISNGPGDHLKYYWRCPEENDEPVSGDEFSTSNWNHYVMIVDPSTSEIRIMLNGFVVEDLSATYSPENDYSGMETRTWMFGSYHPQINNLPHQFFGEIDDIGIWNRALNDAELLALFTNEQPILGCANDEACNFNFDAEIDDGSCLYLDACGECGGDSTSGCTDSYACNFDAEAACDDGSCDYSCCPGPGCCTEGMYWDWELSGCYNINPADINLDGCVQLNDLLGLLSAYGDCGAEESTWQCGDLLEYQGYDYETVQIGEQCWFAENLRNENYENGDAIPADLSDSEWENTTSGAVAVYGDGNSNCYDFSPDGDACDETWSLNEFGRLYNWYAVDDARGLCPSGWHVPTDGEWTVMTDFLGGELVAGGQMKTTFGWNNGGNGSNTSGFRGLPGGFKNWDGSSLKAGEDGNWWSSSGVEEGAWHLFIRDFTDEAFLSGTIPAQGFSVRCIKDSE